MRLRKLEEKDAENMLEWMHDYSVVKDLYTDFSSKTIEDCLRFIKCSLDDRDNIDLAIVDDDDIYMGTVSLKHIDRINSSAEFAITIRKEAMGKGYSIAAMLEMLNIAKLELEIKKVYWCVSKKNLRAVKFYNKNDFVLCENVPQYIKANYPDSLLPELIWYCV